MSNQDEGHIQAFPESRSVVLAVDDRPDNLFILKELVIQYLPECDLITAGSAEEGLTLAESEAVDAVLVDVQMPRIDGIEMCRRLKSRPQTGHLPVALITAHGSTAELRARGLEAGADDFLSRPIDNIELVARIRVLLRTKRAEDQLRVLNLRLEEMVNDRTRSLRSANERVVRILESISDGFMTLDNNLLLTYFNRAAERLLRREAGELLGRPLFEAFPEAKGSVFEERYRWVVKHREPVAFECYFEIPPYDDWYDVRVYPFEDGLSVFFQITTERKSAEEALRERELMLRTLFEEALNPIMLVDDQGLCQDANAAALEFLECTQEELRGRHFWSFSLPDDREPPLGDGLPLSSRRTLEADYCIKGKFKTLLLNVVPLILQDRRVLYSIGQDITERRKTAEALERANRELGEKNQELESIIHIASHDLRSPLVNIQGFSQELARACGELRSLLEDPSSPAEARERMLPILTNDVGESLDYILKGVSKMDSLLGGMLRICRLGRAILEIHRLDMNAMLEDIVKSMDFQIRNVGAVVEVGELPSCQGDAGQINQVFWNLLDNALKYLLPGRPGRIQFGAVQDQAFVVYSVRDNGMGIAPEHHRRIFEVFRRLDPSGPVSGLGLGLAIVARIVDRHGGKMWLESEPEKGSTFFVSLPADRERTMV